VGIALTGSVFQTLIESYDGSSWTMSGSPNTAADQTNELSGVTCSTNDNYWAAGLFQAGSTRQTLIEHCSVPAVAVPDVQCPAAAGGGVAAWPARRHGPTEDLGD
jgi:hypothetical protein